MSSNAIVSICNEYAAAADCAKAYMVGILIILESTSQKSCAWVGIGRVFHLVIQ